MTVEYISARLIHGLSSDTKPTSVPANSIFYETDLGAFYRYDGTYWFELAYHARPDDKKYGSYFGHGTTQADGILNGRLAQTVVGTGTSSAGIDANGTFRTLDTGATINSISGYNLSGDICRRDLNCYFKTKFDTGASIANTRIFAGFTDTAAAPASAADPLNALQGVGLWYDSAVNANWRRFHNDNTGAGVSEDTTLAVATSTIYTVEIFAVGASNKFVFNFNGTYTDITTDIPAATTGLAMWVYIENTTGASRTIALRYIIMRNDK